MHHLINKKNALSTCDVLFKILMTKLIESDPIMSSFKLLTNRKDFSVKPTDNIGIYTNKDLKDVNS